MPERVERIFLGWGQPALVAASEWLLDRAGRDADLGELVVVVPGGRARRMLLGALVDEAESRGGVLTPPIIVTPGEVPAALLGAAGRSASPIARRLAWVDALRSIEGELLAPLLPRPLEAEDLPGWSRLAAALERASDELAGERLRFGDVPARAGDWLPPEEAERWGALGLVQDRAEALLGERGLVDDALGALARAMADGAAPGRGREVVLLATPELNTVERIAIARGAATALVFAPEALAERFDELGCVRSEAWAAAPVDIEERRVVFVDSAREQAEAALVRLALHGSPVDAGAVVIGLADPAALPALRRRAATASGAAIRSSLGEPMTNSLPGRLLRLLGAWLREGGFEALCALARHPDVEAALVARTAPEMDRSGIEWWLAALDEIRREHVLLDPASAPASMRDRLRRALAFVTGALGALLGDALRDPGARRPLHEWADALGAALGAMYTGRALRPDVDADRAMIEALEAVRGALDDLAEASRAGGARADARAWVAIALVEERLGAQFIPEPVRRDAIETLGWLELALDPSPVCVVVGLAESCVPGSVTHDALLPDSLRERLGLRTNERRLARDAFLLAAINASRDAWFIASRKGDDGDPRTPSRLLFRCSGAALARRVRRFARRELDERPPARLASRLAPGAEDRFAPTLRVADDFVAPAAMAVTEFGSYLRSPMGWYLEKSLRLVEHEAPRELSPMLFGNLAHAALESFGRDETARDLDDAGRVADALSDMLTDAAAGRFGGRPPAPVLLQTELLRQRLRLFASWQAERRRAGWRIAQVEWSPAPEAGVGLDVDGAPVGLRGKIDRIDIHDGGGVALIDYKTGRDAGNASSAHRRRDGRWRSLQLPLYRHLARPLGLRGGVTMGFAGLPSAPADGAPWSFASWTAEDLDAADEEARRIVREIRALAPGEAIPGGDNPPERGVLGFVSGARFDLGGQAPGEDEDDGEGEA